MSDLSELIEQLAAGSITRWAGDGSDNREVDEGATDALMAEAASALCAIIDPENQPSQYGTILLATHESALEAKEREIARLEAGLAALLNCRSPLTRAQMREGANDILRGRAGSWPDQSPFLVRAEAAERALGAKETEIAKWKDGWGDMWAKLGDGTLHNAHCNADHQKPVGCDDCSCFLGHLIKDLRRELAAAESQLATARRDAMGEAIRWHLSQAELMEYEAEKWLDSAARIDYGEDTAIRCRTELVSMAATHNSSATSLRALQSSPPPVAGDAAQAGCDTASEKK